MKLKTRLHSFFTFSIISYLLFCSGCNALIKPSKEKLEEDAKNKRAFNSLSQINNIIKTGDVITRTGNDFTSECLRKLCRRNQTYSHCGIASIENDTVFIYHALGGDWNPDQKILREKLVDFGEPSSNRGIGVFRMNISDSFKNAIAQCARDFRKQGIEFDMSFDLKTDNKMYCAEFVAKTIEKATYPIIKISHSHTDELEFIGVDDIFLDPSMKKITQAVYQ